MGRVGGRSAPSARLFMGFRSIDLKRSRNVVVLVMWIDCWTAAFSTLTCRKSSGISSEISTWIREKNTLRSMSSGVACAYIFRIISRAPPTFPLCNKIRAMWLIKSAHSNYLAREKWKTYEIRVIGITRRTEFQLVQLLILPSNAILIWRWRNLHRYHRLLLGREWSLQRCIKDQPRV